MTALIASIVLAAWPFSGPYVGQEWLSPGGGSMVGDLYLNNNIKLCLGTSCDFWMTFNSTATQLELWHTDCDGGGTDCEVMICDAGTDDCSQSGSWTFTGGLNVDADNVKITVGAAGAVDAYLQFDATNLQLYSSGSVEMLSSLIAGVIEVNEDSGAVRIINMEVSGTPADGTEESLCLGIDSNCILKVYAEADGAGGADTFEIRYPQGHLIHHDIEISALGVGATAPAETEIDGTMLALCFDQTTDDKSYFTWHVPTDWDGASDITITVRWQPEAGDAMADGEVVNWVVTYRATADGEDYDATGTSTANTSYTQSGAGTDGEVIYTDITIAYDDGTNPLAVGDSLTVALDRNEGIANDADLDACAFLVEVEYTSNKFLQH